MGPFSGVIIVGKTGGYPANINDGTRYYKGFGNNASANGTSNTIINGFSTNVTYYFRAFGYTTMNNSEWVNTNSLLADAIIKLTMLTFTSSQTWTVPPGIYEIQVFVVGGGGAGGKSTLTYLGDPSGSGGGGGYTKTETIAVTPGQQIPVIIGLGGESINMTGGAGGQTSFGSVVALGGKGGSENSYSYNRGAGGSGGGGAGIRWSTWQRDVTIYAGDGGSDGGDGGESSTQYRTGETVVARGQVGRDSILQLELLEKLEILYSLVLVEVVAV
ncbi:MAG: glycine-rich domain-containing protein [Lacrimispora sphenoides]